MGFEPTTLRSKGFDSTNASPRPTINEISTVIHQSEVVNDNVVVREAVKHYKEAQEMLIVSS